ncbi:MAG: aminopeptidase [Deltaproteobacteria bacterium]|nr:aminopeptidase [Deltaproteobacteria bacterium]
MPEHKGMSLDQAATKLLMGSLGLSQGESCLVVCDPDRENLGATIFKAALRITSEAALHVIQAPGPEGWHPNTLARLEEKLQGYDVILLITSRSLSHTDARRRAVRKGARLASMPGITHETLFRAAQPDYQKVSDRSRKLSDVLSAANTVSVKTSPGTDVTFNVSGMKGRMDSGLYIRKGTWGNIPAGEASIGPSEGTAEGCIVVDWSMSTIGRLIEPLHMDVKNGRAVNIRGRQADMLIERLKPFGGSAFTVAEFGLGTNDCAQLCGLTLEDEKVLGTAHLALGNNVSFGGSTDVPIHLDGVLTEPTVLIDGRTIIKQGRFV